MKKRFYSVSEIKKMKSIEKWALIVSIILVQSIGIVSSIMFFIDTNNILSILPAIGFAFIAWERREMKQ